MEDELYHFGVKGMKWGVRKDRVTPSGKTTSKLRSMDKANRSADRADRKAARKKALSDFWKQTSERDLKIKNARERRPELYKQAKDLKNLYKTERYEIGKYAAKKNLKKSMTEINEEFALSRQKTDLEIFTHLMVGELSRIPSWSKS